MPTAAYFRTYPFRPFRRLLTPRLSSGKKTKPKVMKMYERFHADDAH